MQKNLLAERYASMQSILCKSNLHCWKKINDFLTHLANTKREIPSRSYPAFLDAVRRGAAFVTFDFGIDGVSIEIAKYARSLEKILANKEKPHIHFIGGDFHPPADTILKPQWHRFQLSGCNGWDKWDGGKWFDRLFYKAMPEDSTASDEMAAEIWRQSVSFANRLGRYFAENEIALLIPVNVCSNPGNLALTLAVALVSEMMNLYVLNSNHDFYWEDGKPAFEREAGEHAGSRDHFFTNIGNRHFFTLFKKLYPWNGGRWIQVNINHLQSQKLIKDFGIPHGRVFQISTAMPDAFFDEYTAEDVHSARQRMAHVLSGGYETIRTISIESHLANLESWMHDQTPLVCAQRAGLRTDLTSKKMIYLLQPTRIIARKRIVRDVHLIDALLHHPPFLHDFEKDREKQIVLHITGPTPIEHQQDLEVILKTFASLGKSVSKNIAERLFLAFSAGHEEHACFRQKGFERLTIEEIYRLATAILFPSETEGRGLPILEAGATGIPIICSRYSPVEVFEEVIGETLSKEQRIRYTYFQEGKLKPAFLDAVTDILLRPENQEAQNKHNKKAVYSRYNVNVLKNKFGQLLQEMSRL